MNLSSYLLEKELIMCKKSKRRIDIASFLYKLFLGVMIMTQICTLIMIPLPTYVIVGNISLITYLIFRYYLLRRLRNRALELNLTLVEFLHEQHTCCTQGDECERHKI